MQPTETERRNGTGERETEKERSREKRNALEAIDGDHMRSGRGRKSERG